MTEGVVTKHEYTETHDMVMIPKVHHYRAWVAKNAYLVGTLAFFFILTWIYIFILMVTSS